MEAGIACEAVVISQARDNATWISMEMVDRVGERCLSWTYFEARKKIDFSDNWA